VYPNEFRLTQVTGHVLAWLERRRPGFGAWDEEVEAQLTEEARRALADVSGRFFAMAEDPGYWQRLEHSVFTVALPRYLRLARAHHELQRRQYDLWRGGDLVSRAAYVVVGIVLAVVVARTPIPNWLELLPIALILLGPFLPDLQQSFLERRYRQRLVDLVQDMQEEQRQLETYRPLEDPGARRVGPLTEAGAPTPARDDSKEKT
jgi:hypothetical protein